MKLSKETLKQIIKEEIDAVMSEGIGGINGLIRYINSVNADRRTKEEAIDAVARLSKTRIGFDDSWAEQTAEKMSKQDPEEFLSDLINFAHNELEM